MTAFTIIIPTLGRPTLRRTLNSLDGETSLEDDVLVIADTHSGRVRRAPALARRHWATYLEHDAGYHHFGQPQRNYGIEQAREGTYLVWIDDTDWIQPGALDQLRQVIDGLKQPAPVLVSFIDEGGNTIHARRDLQLGNVGGHQFITPNIPGLVARWGTTRYEGDWDFIERTLKLWPANSLQVHPEIVIAACERPKIYEHATP